MGLSDHEKEILAQLEESLRTDTDFASKVNGWDREGKTAQGDKSFSAGLPPKTKVNPRRILLGAIILLVGLGLLLGGVTQGYNLLGVAISVVGVLLMMVGMYVIFTPSTKGRTLGRSGSFSEKQKERFQERRSDR
ncbi:DUF3040 domain-containing protein [Actinomycetaceae bacterium TAE3-ERU4]|nr:DUF3040 domain-containing protein [Actinomycetaceae bacterium TAE3-ERU4]